MTVGGPCVLLVDDNEQNLLALEAIVEPLGHRLVRARSGDEALRALLHDDFAVILLDVQMPGLDGFETATLIKRRERTRHVPIVFLTAHDEERAQVFRAYEAGAVDYIFKPFNPDVLRSKISVFVELWQKNEQLREQAERLRRQELAELERASEARYQALAEAMPQMIWMTDSGGTTTYVNRRWTDYTGLTLEQTIGDGWLAVVHPDDLAGAVSSWRDAMRSGEPYETEFRLRRARDGVYRWQLGRALPTYDTDGTLVNWVGTCTDIDDRKRLEQSQAFLLEAGALLASSLDYEQTLAAVARAAVPQIADWCTVSVVEPDSTVRQLAVAHVDPQKVQFVRELQERYPPDPQAEQGPAKVVRTGKPEFVPTITDDLLVAAARDELHLDLLRELGLRSYVCVPLVARERVLGAMAFVRAESGRSYDEADVALAEELARRAATAVDNARLFRAAEERGRAARVLASIGDGVVLVDGEGVIRLWNPAAETITGLSARDVVGERVEDVVPGWRDLTSRIPVAPAGAATVRPETVPVELSSREVWLSMSGVQLEEGTVYAFRDLTEERGLEQLKAHFVATVSHELRTPLAAIYGSAQTMRRQDLDDEMRDRLLRMISDESDRLATIVNDLLLASQLDADRLTVTIEQCDVAALADAVLESARVRLPDGRPLEIAIPPDLPPVAADAGHLQQVLVNLVDNAIKYSPDGGPVRVSAEAVDSRVRIAVADQGLGIHGASSGGSSRSSTASTRT